MKKNRKKKSRTLPVKVVHPAVPMPMQNVPPGTHVTMVMVQGDLNGKLTIGSSQPKEPKPIALVEKLVHWCKRLAASFAVIAGLMAPFHGCLRVPDPLERTALLRRP